MGTISRVTTWSTGDTLTAADLNGEFDNILSTANGSLNADNLGVTAGIASALKAVVLDSNKDFADGTGSNQIRNLTISGSLAIGTTFLPDAAGGADLGSATLEWGDLYIADDKYIKLGSDQNILIGYDETTTDSLKIAATEGAGLAITLMADEGDDAGDEWKLNVADGGTITLGNDIASAGTYVTHLTLTPHATVASSTLALAGGLTVAGATQANGTVTVGADDQGYDVKLFGDTASAYLLWDTSADKLLTAGGATIDIVKDKLLIGGTAVTTTAAELNFLDTASAGTVVASKAVVVDSNKDISSFRNVTLTGELDAATGDFSGDVDVDGTLEADAITLGGTALGSLYSPIAGSTSIVTVGTVGTGTWQATKVASAYLDDDTAHLTTTQTFSGAKTFSAAAQFSNTVTVGVNGTGYDVQLFGDTAGSSVLWDQSADDLILTNAGLAVGSDATGDVYYRDANGFLARLGASTDGHVLTTGGSGTIPAWEAAPGSGSFSGPGSSTENAVVRFTNTSGNAGDNSGILIDDSNNVTGAANVTLSGELDAATGDFSGIIDVAGVATLASLVCTAAGTFGGGYGDTGATISTAGVGQFNGNLTTDGLLAAATMTLSSTSTISGDMTFVDNAKVTLGTGGDADIYYDATNLVLTPDVAGSGYINLNGDSIVPVGHSFVVGHTAPIQTPILPNAQVVGTDNDTATLQVCRFSADAHGPIISTLKSRNGTIGSNTIVQDGDSVMRLTGFVADGGDFVSNAGKIALEIDGTPGANDTPGRWVFSTTADGASDNTERMWIGANGNIGVGAAPSSNRVLDVTTASNIALTEFTNTHASFAGAVFLGQTNRAANSGFNFFNAQTNIASSADTEFLLRGDGEAYADGSWNASGADYQEWFESADGTEYEVGKAVVLDGDKVRVYNAATDSADNIMGITRPQADNKNSAVIGNTAWNHWTDKYLTDDWGVYIREDVTVWGWDEVKYVEGDELPDDKDVGTVKIKAGSCYERDEAEDWTPPEGAVSSLQSVRKLNPAYSVEVDDETNYTPRADRAEWNLIGMLGQVQIKADEPTNPRWIKMKDISDAVEMWMIR